MPGRDPTVIINAVAVEEPDGYRGRRRRFLLSRKGGGAALPALLVAASVMVVLIVVGVSQLLPRDANGQIPLGGGNNGAATDDNGQPQSGDGSAPGSQGASGRPSRSAGKPTPSPPGVPTTPSSRPTGAAPFAPFAVEAENAGMGGGARSSGCGGCSGGSKVRFIGANSGWVKVTVPNVPGAGPRQLTITYELGEPSRTFYLSINGGAGAPVTVTSNITDWSTPLSATVQVTLAGGTNTIKFYNPTTNPAPDLDKVSVK